MKRFKKVLNIETIEIPCDKLVEINIEYTGKLFTSIEIDQDVKDCIVKPIVTMKDKFINEFDKNGFRDYILSLGAKHCKTPTVQIIREKVKRDERHSVKLTMRESLEIFAEETNLPEKQRRSYIDDAIKIAREADVLVK